MALPKKKISKVRGRRRYKKFQYETRKRLANQYTLTLCSNCQSKKLPFFVCPTCGMYKENDVLDLENKQRKEEKKITKIKA